MHCSRDRPGRCVGGVVVLSAVFVLLVPFGITEEPLADSSRPSPPFSICSLVPEEGDSNEIEIVSIRLDRNRR